MVSQDLAPLPIDAVTLKDGHPITTSLSIAEIFGKDHKNVMRDIRRLDCSEEFRRLNFEPTDYIDKNGDVQPMFDIRRDGCMFLIMGFTGAEAAVHKEAYIVRFNELEAVCQASAAQLQALAALLFAARPDLGSLYRYHTLGLNKVEMARLMQRSEHWVRRHLADLAAAGLLVLAPKADRRQLDLFAEVSHA